MSFLRRKIIKKEDPNIKKTIHEWQQEYDFAIMDPDGFDRKDPKMRERLYTRKEFEQRVCGCTLVSKGNSMYESLKKYGMKP